MAQDTAHAKQHTERAHRWTGAKWPMTPHKQNKAPSRHTGEQEPSGAGHRTRSTTQHAATPVNRSQGTQDTAHATQHTALAHRCRVERLNKLVGRFSGRPGSGEFRTWKENLLRAFALSDITSTVNQVTTIPFLLEGDVVEYYHSLTKVVQDDWFELMCVWGQRFDCIPHDPVYLSRMSTLKESEFPRHADYVKEFRTCVIKSKVNTSDLQMSYLVISRFVEGLSNDTVRRQYIVEVRSRWHSGRPFGFDTLVETIAEAYMAAAYQLEEVQNASRTTPDTMGPVVSRPYDGPTNFDFNVSFQPYANTARQPLADPSCGPHGFDCARANEPRCNCQPPRRTTCLHW